MAPGLFGGGTVVVNPPELARQATTLSAFVDTTHAQVPTPTVVAAGMDPISQMGAARLAQRGAMLTNLSYEGLYKLDAAAYVIGGAAAGYEVTDVEGAAAVGSASGAPPTGAGPMTNPVPPPQPIAPIAVPGVPGAVADVGWESDWFAAQLRAGDGGTSVRNFQTAWGQGYAQGTHNAITNSVQQTRAEMHLWQPVGTEVATLFDQFQAWHENVGVDARTLAGQAQAYDAAYRTVVAQHPQPGEHQAAQTRYTTAVQNVQAAQQEVQVASAAVPYSAPALAAAKAHLAAAKSEQQAAQANLRRVEQEAQSAQQQYRSAIESGVPAEAGFSGYERAPDIANPLGGLGNALGDIGRGLLSGLPGMLGMLNQPGGLDIPSVPPPSQLPPPTVPTAPSSDASSQIPNMPPLGDPGATSDDELIEEPYPEEPYPLDDYGGYGGGPGGGGVGGMPTSAMAGVPLTGTGGSAPKVAAARQFGMPAAGGRAAGAGGMPYMPFMPGMGGANPNTGDRKNPFAEEKKIVDDDELRSSALASATVNEKPPVLPPEATRPTPDRTSATNQESAIA